MKCLITGGAGFIGSHLCDRLIEDGHSVLCVDNLITGSEKNITHLRENGNFQFLNLDVTSELLISETFDVIFHLASPASPPKYQKYPVETWRVNTHGTFLLLELAKKNNAHFIYASTSEVYGDPEEHPQKESYWGHVNPVGIRSCYDESKRAGESLVMTYSREYNLPITICRIFNTYGPRMDIDDGRVVTNFIKQILEKTSLTIYGDGSQTRSFCYVTDLVTGFHTIMKTESAKGEIINLGNTQEMTVLELVQKLQQIAQYEGKIEYKALPSDDPVRRKPDTTKAERIVSWKTQITLEEGLLKTLNYFRQ